MDSLPFDSTGRANSECPGHVAEQDLPYANPLQRGSWIGGWISGFTDAEGCFSINVIQQPDRVGRRGYVLGYQIAHEFVITQSEISLCALHFIRGYLGCGEIYANPVYDRKKLRIYRYAVRKRDHLLKIILPFFQSNPLKTAKSAQFETFRTCLQMVAENAHLNVKGLIEILRLSETINQRRSRAMIIDELLARDSR